MEDIEQLHQEITSLQRRLSEAEEALTAIRTGEADALVVYQGDETKVYTLQGAEHPYRVIVETIYEGAATLQKDGTILYCNQRLADMLQVPLESLMGDSLVPYISPDDREIFEALVEHGLQGSIRIEVRFQTGAGIELPVMLSLSPTDDVQSQRTFCLVATDLSEQKRNDEILAAERLSSSIFDQAGEAILVCDPFGKILRASRRAHRMTMQNPLLKYFDDIFHLEQVRLSENEEFFSLRAVQKGKSFRGVEVRLKPTAAGEESLALLLNATPLLGDGRILGSIISLIDISILKKMEQLLQQSNQELEKRVIERTAELENAAEELENTIEELEVAEEELRTQNVELEKALHTEKTLRNQLIQTEKFAALSRLMGSVAHEMNNPLQTVKNCLYLLGTEIVSDESKGILEMARSESQRMAMLLQQLRETYRPSSIKPIDFNVIEVVTRVFALLAPQLRQGNIQGELLHSQNRIMVHGVPDQIQQVCLNICLNAIDAMGSTGGQLKVEVSLVPRQVTGQKSCHEQVCLTFQDTGPGVPEEYLGKIFEPFFTTKEKGTGLGLAISYEIIKDHAGEITVESQPGQGATFKVWLPVC